MLDYEIKQTYFDIVQLERVLNNLFVSRFYLHVLMTFICDSVIVLLNSILLVDYALCFNALVFVDDLYWKLHYTLQELQDGILLSSDYDDERIGSYEGYDISEDSAVVIARSDNGWIGLSN